MFRYFVMKINKKEELETLIKLDLVNANGNIHEIDYFFRKK